MDHTEDCFVLEGKMALPNQYFAGRLGSRFIIALRDKKKIMGVRCETCNITFVPPREYCEKCWSKIDENWVDLGTTGELVNFTVVRYNDRHLPLKAPYVLGQIKLEGADTALTHLVLGVDPKEVSVGMKVKAVFAGETKGTIMDLAYFEPV